MAKPASLEATTRNPSRRVLSDVWRRVVSLEATYEESKLVRVGVKDVVP